MSLCQAEGDASWVGGSSGGDDVVFVRRLPVPASNLLIIILQ